MAEELLRVGVITSPHGIRGEVNVYPTTDEPDMFEEWETLTLRTKKGDETVHVTGVKFFKNMIILQFKEVPDRNGAELLREAELYIHRSQARECGEYEDFVVDLIGMNVVLEDGTPFGVCTDVMETGANDVYEVKRTDGKTILLPAIRSCILDTDTETNTMTVSIPEGLL